jgi:hypothetical protein
VTTHTIEVIGKDAHRRVLEALSKSFPTSTAETSDGQVLKSIHNSKETKTMTHQDLLMAKLDKEMTLLEAEIDGLVKQSRRRPVDDWSDTPTGNANAAADNEDDDEDNGVDDDEDDDEDLDKIAKATKFQAMARKIAVDEGLPKAEAMTQARLRYPDLYAGFKTIDDVTAKSYRSLVQQEIRKGCSADVAAQRVSYAHPDLARQTMAKAAASPVEFMAKVDETMQASGCSRTTAMQQVRKQQPELFRKFQNV